MRSQFEHLQNSVYLPIACAVAVLVVGAILFAVLRYRERPGRTPSERTDAPRIEALWAAGIAAIVVVLVVNTFSTEAKTDAVSPHPGLRVEVTAARWSWTFSYPGTGIVDHGSTLRPAVLHVPTGTVVQFRLTSRDVIHSFWIPGLRFKRDAFPKRTTTFDLTFGPGKYANGRCAEFCGLHHGDMEFVVDAQSPAAFRRWLAGRRASGARA